MTEQHPLPHNLQAEESLLGAMLLSADAVETGTNALGNTSFYSTAHGHIFDAIAQLHGDGHPVDPTTVTDQLARNSTIDQIGDISLIHLQAQCPSVANAARYVSIIRHHAALRDLVHLGRQITEGAQALPDDLSDLRARVDAAVELLDRSAADTAARHVGDLLQEWIDEVERRAAGDHTAIPTGFIDLDKFLGGGLRAGQLVVVCGRTSMGKTAFAGSLALNVAAQLQPTLVCSIEMAELELADRWMAAASHVRADTIRNGAISEKDWLRVNAALGTLANRPLYIDDRDDLGLGDIRALARSMPEPPAMIIVDYLQLVRPTKRSKDRHVEVAELSGGLKRLARKLQIPIVALAQLNRDAENRTDRRPKLTDLRESGSIENDADVVIGLYRDEYYKPDTKDTGVLEAIVLKQRSGPLGTARLHFAGDINAVLNLAKQEAA